MWAHWSPTRNVVTYIMYVCRIVAWYPDAPLPFRLASGIGISKWHTQTQPFHATDIIFEISLVSILFSIQLALCRASFLYMLRAVFEAIVMTGSRLVLLLGLGLGGKCKILSVKHIVHPPDRLSTEDVYKSKLTFPGQGWNPFIFALKTTKLFTPIN